MQSNELFNFIEERYKIYLKRQKGWPKPWTKDLILQQYKFCNVYRELDTVTQWIAENWRDPNKNDPNLWFAMAVARYINWPPTLAEIGYPKPKTWQETVECVLENRKAREEKVFSGAYIVSTNGQKMDKGQYVIKHVLAPLWQNRAELQWADKKGLMFASLAAWHFTLSQQHGVGSFMAGQIIADCKYTIPLTECPDWWTFAASGPGSRRGLNRVMNREVNMPRKEEAWYSNLITLKNIIDPLLKQAGMPKMHAQDLQNCLCEFDKYERVRLGEGRPRSLYPGV